MQGSEYHVSGFCGRQRQADGLQVSHFTNQDDIGILTQCTFERVGEGFGVGADFALADEAIFGLVNKFNRVFDGEDMSFFGFVAVVDHCSQGGGFTGASGAGNQTDAAWLHG